MAIAENKKSNSQKKPQEEKKVQTKKEVFTNFDNYIKNNTPNLTFKDMKNYLKISIISNIVTGIIIFCLIGLVFFQLSQSEVYVLDQNNKATKLSNITGIDYSDTALVDFSDDFVKTMFNVNFSDIQYSLQYLDSFYEPAKYNIAINTLNQNYVPSVIANKSIISIVPTNDLLQIKPLGENIVEVKRSYNKYENSKGSSKQSIVVYRLVLKRIQPTYINYRGLVVEKIEEVTK